MTSTHAQRQDSIRRDGQSHEGVQWQRARVAGSKSEGLRAMKSRPRTAATCGWLTAPEHGALVGVVEEESAARDRFMTWGEGAKLTVGVGRENCLPMERLRPCPAKLNAPPPGPSLHTFAQIPREMLGWHILRAPLTDKHLSRWHLNLYSTAE